jgi:hypothetical protein
MIISRLDQLFGTQEKKFQKLIERNELEGNNFIQWIWIRHRSLLGLPLHKLFLSQKLINAHNLLNLIKLSLFLQFIRDAPLTIQLPLLILIILFLYPNTILSPQIHVGKDVCESRMSKKMKESEKEGRTGVEYSGVHRVIIVSEL